MSVGFNIRLINLFICKFPLNFSGFGLRFCNYKFRKMRVSNYRRVHKVHILLNISGKCGFQNAAGPTGVRAQPVKNSSRNSAGSMRRLKAAFSNSIETPKVGSQIGQDGEIFPSSPS